MYDVQFAAAVPKVSTKTDMDRLIEIVSKAGYSGLELDAQLLSTEEGADAVRPLFDKHQIAPVSAIYPVEAENRNYLVEIESIIDNLEGLGAEHLILSSSENHAELPLKLKAIGERCTTSVLLVSYRPSAHELSGGLTSLETFTNLLPGKTLGLAPDLSLLLQAGVSPLEFFRLYGSRCDYLSVSNADSSPLFSLSQLAEAFDAANFTGWIAVRPEENPMTFDYAALRSSLQSAFGY